ncbi:hypothetical protein [uncultured Hymenobacter sp.]|uniref:hypothetical protein n=1 Tax=uncultured Hymenobacter sp. TaxID=170016 RepID=UPI0035CC2383
MRPAAHGADDTSGYCLPPQVFTIDTLPAVGSAPASSLDTMGLPPLSARSRQLARAYGLGPGLRQLRQPAQPGLAPGDAAQRAFIRQREALVLQVVQASGDALRVAEELECERQRADQAALALQGQQTKRTRNFTLGSLLAGAASGVISATVLAEDRANLNLVLTVSTAALSAGLGVATLFVNPQLNYPIRRNLLADIWYQRPRPALYPPGLWATLNEVRVGRPGSAAPAPLQTIRRRWAQYDQLTSGKPAQQAQQLALYFGAGGNYHADDLHTRAAMLTQLEVMVRLVNQDLQKLLVEVSNTEPQ